LSRQKVPAVAVPPFLDNENDSAGVTGAGKKYRRSPHRRSWKMKMTVQELLEQAKSTGGRRTAVLGK